MYKINDRIVMVARNANTNDPPNGSRGTIGGMGPYPGYGGSYYTVEWDDNTCHHPDAPDPDDPLEHVACHDQIALERESDVTSASPIAAAVAAPHYGDLDDPHASINVIEAWGLGYHLGNVVKYVKRAGHKPGNPAVQDLRKAAWYLERAIANLESGDE